MKITQSGFERAWGFEWRRPLAQKTLRAPIPCTGIGLHSGKPATMTLCPAEPDSGITFVRTDLPGAPAIPARWDHVADTRMCTVLANDDGVAVGTVEHLMAAFAGAGVDNVVVEIDGPEVPIMDGSSEPFTFLIDCAGLVSQPSPRRALRILTPVGVEGDGWSASLVPGAGFSIGFEIDFASAAIARQSMDLSVGDGVFEREIGRARTFGFLEEVERLRSAGLARGGTLDNVVVVAGDRVLNESGLRFQDEFVRHKVLDAIGDLYLAGGQIIGHFQGSCSGHAANNQLLHAVFETPDAWTWDTVRSGDALDSGDSPRWSAGLAVAGSA